MRYLTATEAATTPLAQLQDGQWLPQGQRVIRLAQRLLTVSNASYRRAKEMKVARALPQRTATRPALAWLVAFAQLALIVVIVAILAYGTGRAIWHGFHLVGLAVADAVKPVHKPEPLDLSRFEQRRMSQSIERQEI